MLHYNGLDWEIGEMPVGSSTPDEFFELEFNAIAKCPSCGDTIHGTASYWSREEDMSSSWFNDIHYEPCECEESQEEEDNDLDDDEII